MDLAPGSESSLDERGLIDVSFSDNSAFERKVMTDHHILLAEDDPAHATLIQRAIERADCSCRVGVVEDGVEAIDYLFATGSHAGRDSEDMPDLILLDLKMPKIDGLQLLQLLRRVRSPDRKRFPPVVILTSSDRETDVVKAYNLGAYSYIQKPAGFPELVQAVRQIVEYWLQLNTSPPVYSGQVASGMLP